MLSSSEISLANFSLWAMAASMRSRCSLPRNPRIPAISGRVWGSLFNGVELLLHHQILFSPLKSPGQWYVVSV